LLYFFFYRKKSAAEQTGSNKSILTRLMTTAIYKRPRGVGLLLPLKDNGILA